MKTRILTMVAAVALLAACSSTDENATKAGGATAAAPAKAGTSIVPGSQADFVANVGDRVFFGFDKSDLSPEARQQLTAWVAFLKKYPQDNLTVEGHADERGTREYNIALGEKRANSVKEFLVAQGVQASRLKTV
ncbi:MAG TPA: OmpA family protein, partial [Candidatus Sulfotelmatobacter sp.]|nr:OmpA family protein [Candidatus Sulfotelmatobacter sp.]